VINLDLSHGVGVSERERAGWPIAPQQLSSFQVHHTSQSVRLTSGLLWLYNLTLKDGDSAWPWHCTWKHSLCNQLHTSVAGWVGKDHDELMTCHSSAVMCLAGGQ
jgi:hypothetical protein